MKRVAKFLERLNFAPDSILTSPLPRASQTAEIVADRFGIALKTEPGLAHGFNLERLRRIIAKLECACVVVVGHEPEFSEVIKQLAGGEVKLSKAGIALLEVNRSCTSARLLWLFPPKIAKAMS